MIVLGLILFVGANVVTLCLCRAAALEPPPAPFLSEPPSHVTLIEDGWDIASMMGSAS